MNALYTLEANKLSAAGAWLVLLEISYTGQTTQRYTSNNESTVWNGNTYTPMPFQMDDIEVSTDGRFPEYSLQIFDVELWSTLRVMVRNTGGLTSGVVRLYVVHSDHLDLTDAAVDEAMEILDAEVSAGAVIFRVGMPNLLSRRFPRDRNTPGFCRHQFQNALCKYPESPAASVAPGIMFFPSPIPRLYSPLFNFINFFGGGSGFLTSDTVFSVEGSLYNDGYFIADRQYRVTSNTVYVHTVANGGRQMATEIAAGALDLTLGYIACDHTLDDCRKRNNSQNYGGSPGVVGALYG